MAEHFIESIETRDVRVPLPAGAGSDAVHSESVYGFAMTLLRSGGISGTGLVLTMGAGTEIVCQAIEVLADSLPKAGSRGDPRATCVRCLGRLGDTPDRRQASVCGFPRDGAAGTLAWSTPLVSDGLGKARTADCNNGSAGSSPQSEGIRRSPIARRNRCRRF
jgi:hypothetical protein